MTKHLPVDELRRALVIKLRHHGDVLLTSPVLTALKAHALQCEIDALIYADTRPMLEGHPSLTNIFTIDRQWKQLGIVEQARAEGSLVKQLRARKYDLVIHLTEHRRGAWLTRLLAPKFSVAPGLSSRGRLWKGSFTHFVAQPTVARRHMVERNLDSLRQIGIQPTASQRAVTMVPGKAAEARISALLTEYHLPPNGFLHLHPTSRWHFKCWTAVGWTQVIDALTAAGYAIALTCAPDPKERAMLEAIIGRLARPIIDLGGMLDLRELAALAAAARLFVGVDSAPMHIAAAMGTPVVALFGPSGELEWGPWGTPRHGRHHVVASLLPQHSCRPCGLDGCGGGKVSDCLVGLGADRVLAPIRELLA